jgi:hypothetical protein
MKRIILYNHEIRILRVVGQVIRFPLGESGRKNMKRQHLLLGLFFCGFWLLASSEYELYQNRFSNRTEIRDRSGRTKGYLRENRYVKKEGQG